MLRIETRQLALTIILFVSFFILTACAPSINTSPVSSTNGGSPGPFTLPTPTPTPAPTPNPTAAAVTVAQLTGTWQSGCFIDAGNSATSRVTFNANGTVNVTAPGYQGTACQGGVIINIVGTGTYTLGALSATVTGATNVNFQITSVTGTPASAIGALGLNLQAFCNYTGWQNGVAYQIPIGSACLSTVPQGNSILAITGNTLYLGNPAGTALETTVPLIRQ